MFQLVQSLTNDYFIMFRRTTGLHLLCLLGCQPHTFSIFIILSFKSSTLQSPHLGSYRAVTPKVHFDMGLFGDR